MNNAGDGFGREIDWRHFSQDNAGDGAFGKRNEDDLAREERLLGRIGESAAAVTVDISRYDLEKHNIIIALHLLR